MLLAIVGGSMAFAWAPADNPPAAVVWDEPRGEFRDEFDDDFEDDPPTDEQPGGTARGGHRQWVLAIAAAPAIMLASLVGTPGARAATAAPQRSGGSCILLIICLPSPTPSPTTPTPRPTPRASGAPQPLVGTPGSAPAAGNSGKRRTARRRAEVGGGLVAATATSVITASSATLDHLAYQGAANVPVAGGATERMMKFTATSITLSGDVTASVTQHGAGGTDGTVTTLTTSPVLAFSGGVVLYATRLSGCLGALCVTLTPDNAVTVLLRLASGVTGSLTLTLTKVTTNQPLVIAGALQAAALKIRFASGH
jgi:hypothetical protein